MDYSIIGKIHKAKEYAEEPERVTFHNFQVEFKGNNDTYIVTLGPEGWHCTCPGFQHHGICPHTMALEKMFKPMLKREAQPYGAGQNRVSDIEKAHEYAEEPDRIRFMNFEASFRGGHNEYNISYNEGKWDCDNPYFRTRGMCSNTIAMEKLLKGMVQPVMLEQPESESE